MKRRSYLAAGAIAAALVAVLVGTLLATNQVAQQQAPAGNEPRAAPRGWTGLSTTPSDASGADDQGPGSGGGSSDDTGSEPQGPPWAEEPWYFPPKWGLRFGNAAEHASVTAMAKTLDVAALSEHPGQGKMLGIQRHLAVLLAG